MTTMVRSASNGKRFALQISLRVQGHWQEETYKN